MIDTYSGARRKATSAPAARFRDGSRTPWSTLWAAPPRGHHHHLVCRDCDRTVEVTGPTVERWAEKIAAEHGFTDVGHSLEIFGLCTTCAD